MKPVDMRLKDDCFKCCVASILELTYEEVPNFFEGDRDYFDCLGALQQWLRDRDMYYICVRAFEVTPCDQLWMQGHHIIIGEPIGRIDESLHAVVGYQGQLEFDPHKSRAFVRPMSFGFLCRY